LKKALEDAPAVEGVEKYLAKLAQEIGTLADRDPAAGEKLVAEAKEFLTALGDKSEDDGVKAAVTQSARTFAALERQITSARKLAELVGKDAAPLNVEGWVNGEPLTDDDLKGKVVLLDFWAVWCGPCIATFPHLREWNEKYGPEGLTIIGLTRYYNFKWDEETGRATRSEEEVSPEDEQEMLKKFAAHYKLEHRFGIQKDASLAEHYAVAGIPHVVLIDRAGKVALVRVGSGPANAKDIDEKIKELLSK
jgi:thiol-disulfide isomerase/thioredoxin